MLIMEKFYKENCILLLVHCQIILFNLLESNLINMHLKIHLIKK